MLENYLENLWNFMKSCGHYKDFEDYKSWRENKFKIKAEPLKEIGVDEIRNQEYENWKAEMPAEERNQYNFIFNEK